MAEAAREVTPLLALWGGVERTAETELLVGLPLFCRRKLQDMLTIVLVTSIVPSNPDTSMIEAILGSYLKFEPMLVHVPKIIVCDKPKFSANGRRHYKSGIVLSDDYPVYEEYICNLEKFAAANVWPFVNTTIYRCPAYRGFCFAVKDALLQLKTSLVMIVQHDRALCGSFDVLDVCETMMCDERIKYVGLPTSSSVQHSHRMRSKYQIVLDPGFLSTLQGRPLCPLLFWYDSTHIARVSHYLDFAFGWHNPKQPFRLCTGDFFEDKLGQHELTEIKSNGYEAVHGKYGTFVLDTDSPLVRHWHGRKVGTSNARKVSIYTQSVSPTSAAAAAASSAIESISSFSSEEGEEKS